MKLNEEQKQQLEKKFKRFKKKYFKGRSDFSGAELEDCKHEFMEKHKLWSK